MKIGLSDYMTCVSVSASVCNRGQDDRSPFTLLLCFSSSHWKGEEMLLDFIVVKDF